MQERTDTKRSREVNWTTEEREALRKCIQPYMGIIEDKNNDGPTIARKKKAWQNIKKTMQAAGYDRDADKFRAGWVRMKFSDRHSRSAEGKTTEANGSIKDYNISDNNMTEAFSADDESTFMDGIKDELAEQTEAKKRVRETNWTSKEKAYLREFINAHIAIIEDKSNDNRTIKKKREAWNQIKMKMLRKGYNRNWNRIRQQWVRMKLAERRSEGKVKPETCELSSLDSSDDMCFDSMMGAEELVDEPLLVESRNETIVIEQRQEDIQMIEQRQAEEKMIDQKQVVDKPTEQRQEQVKKEQASSSILKQHQQTSNTDEIHMLQAELLRAQIQYHKTLECNERELHALKMQHARQMHARKMQLLQKQINDQKSTADPLEKAINGALWD